MGICASAASSHKKKNKKKSKAASAAVTPSACLSVDSGFLCCAHHEVMVAGLSMLGVGTQQNKDVPVSVLLVGLGGGGLPQFLRDFVPNATVEVVELDPVVLEVAKEWFGFRPDERLSVTLGDGLERISSLEKEGGRLFDVIMFDVDNKDSSLGMSCPPAAFVETPVLQKVFNVLSPRGLFMLNLVCRDPILRKTVLERVRSVFPTILSRKIAEEINEVLLCFREEKDAAHILPSLSQAAKNFQSTLSYESTEPKRRPHIDIAEMLKDLVIE
ncbi:eEF1A lysine and N-terminal methyltransferase-like [Fundulus diaphanus]